MNRFSWVKRVCAVVLCVLLISVLLFAGISARRRGRLTHCRNNLRFLGLRAMEKLRNPREIPREKRGRAFWQWIRDEYEGEVFDSDTDKPVKWRLRVPDPYVCPVLGTTVIDYSDPARIDYRGPREDSTKVSASRPFGADRPGNHGAGEGGFILFLNLQVKNEVSINPIGEGDSPWKEAAQATSD